MREILFRGKRVNIGDWIEGSLWMDLGVPKILTAGNIVAYDVIPATVGQYTGLTANGKRIFEGDIMDIGEMICTVNGRYFVVYDTANHCWGLKRSVVHHHHYFTFSDLNGFNETSEIIGNIWDNPELLEGGDPDA